MANGIHIEDMDIAVSPLAVHVIYRQSGLLRHAQWDGTTWVTETVEPAGMDGATRLVVTPAGELHAAFGYGNELHYGHWNGYAWSTELIDDDRNPNFRADIAVDSSGSPHIAYCTNRTPYVMRYATRPAP